MADEKHMADNIARSLVKQYYEMLSKNPSELYKFYSEQSYFLHCENSQKCDSVFGSEAIKDYIENHLNLAGAHVDITNGSIDAQKSDNNGIIVVVTGHYTPCQQATRPFIQTFFLADSNYNKATGKAPRYAVSNSVFRVLVDNTLYTPVVDPAVVYPPVVPVFDPYHPPAGMEYYAAAVAAGSVPVYPTMEPVPVVAAAPAAPEEEQPVASEPAAVEPEEESPEVVDEPVSAQAAPEPTSAAAVAAAEEAQQEDESSGTKSYSDIVKKIKATAAAAASENKAGFRVVKTAQSGAPANAAPSGAQNGSKGNKSGAKSGEKSAGGAASATSGAALAAAGAGASAAAAPVKTQFVLYVSQLPEQFDGAELKKLFSQFGNIRNVDTIFGRSYAFVKYENADGLRAALNYGKTIDFNGKAVRIEERSGNSSGGNSGSRGDGGRNRGSNNNNSSNNNNNNASSNSNSKSQGGQKSGGDERKKKAAAGGAAKNIIEGSAEGSSAAK